MKRLAASLVCFVLLGTSFGLAFDFEQSMAELNQVRDLCREVRAEATQNLQVAPQEIQRCLELCDAIESYSNQLESTLDHVKQQSLTPTLQTEWDGEYSHFQQLTRQLETAAAILSEKIPR